MIPSRCQRQLTCREKDLQRQVETVKQQLRDMHSSAESSQAKLLDASQRQEQDVAARLAELDMVAADLTRANERVATVERRNVSGTSPVHRDLKLTKSGTVACRD